MVKLLVVSTGRRTRRFDCRACCRQPGTFGRAQAWLVDEHPDLGRAAPRWLHLWSRRWSASQEWTGGDLSGGDDRAE